MVVYSFYNPIIIGRGILVASVLFSLVTVPLYRLIHYYISGEAAFTQKILIVGTGPMARVVIDEVEKYQFSGYVIVGVVDDHNNKGDFEGYKILGDFTRLRELVEAANVDTIVVALSEQRGRLPIEQLTECKMRGIKVINDTTFHEQFTGKIMVSSLRPSFLIFSDGFKISRFTKMIKYGFDIGISVLLLLMMAPVLLITGLLVYLTSPGPIFYRQERVGLHGKPFTLYKFRSMQVDSEDKSGPVWAQKNDQRVTRVGRIIRRFRIDELPQIYNVLKGEMSFVGPRPERTFFVNKLVNEIPYYKLRLVIKPGLTGWAQIRYPYGNSIHDAQEKLQYDLYYIKSMSWLFDLKIISETTKVVLGKMGEGTY